MVKPSIKLADLEFAHAHTMQNGDRYFDITYFDWYRGPDYRDITFYTDRCLGNALTDSKYHVALLLEPEVINPNSYNFIAQHYDRFDYVLTHHQKYVARIPNARWYKYGGCWIKESDVQMYNKKKDVSIIISPKHQTEGHQMRHAIVKHFGYNLDLVFGGSLPYGYKLDALADFRYSIVVENCREPHYISEKLTDCFFTGTIPIYWGSPGLEDWFNMDGILTFSDFNELQVILTMIGPEDYVKRLEAAEDNYFLASSSWKISEDSLWTDFIEPVLLEGRKL